MSEHHQGEWDGVLYAANSAHHRATDERLIADLDLGPESRVIDLGCGSGALTARLAALVPHGEVIGVDASASMVEVASTSHTAPNLRFRHLAAQQLADAAEDGSIDAIVSVACLHWIPAADQPIVLGQIARLLRPGGILRADFGGRGQIAAPRVILDEESAAVGGPINPWYFPRPDEYRPLLEDAGFLAPQEQVQLRHERREFADADALLGMLRSQTYMAYDGEMTPADRAIFHAAVDARVPQDLLRHDGTYDLDFVRMDVLARRS